VSLAWPVQRHCGGLAGQVETAAFPNRACRRTESRLAIAPAVLAARRRKVCRAATKHCPPHRRKELCETSHNRIYVQRSIMCSGGVVIGVFPAQRDSGGCAAAHIIDSFEKTIVRAEMRNGRQLGGRRHVIAPLVSGAGSLVFRSLPPELPSADVRPRIGPVAAISTDRRVVASSASRRLCAAVSALKGL
jgi:hypothetical protein